MGDEVTDALGSCALAGAAAPSVAANLALLHDPPLFDLEVASACNVECTFCPRRQLVRRRPLMDAETFEAVLDFLPDGATAMLSGLGDALLHPDLPELVGRLVARGVSTCATTNGVRLTPPRQDALIAAGIAELQVSVHGLEEATVRRVTPVGADPDAVRRHVERLARAGGPRLRINFVETEHNAHERPGVEAWASSLGARFFHRHQHTRGGTTGAPRLTPSRTGCGIFGAVTFVSVDGDVLPCVNDVRGTGRLGSVRETTWRAVLAWKQQVITAGRWFAPCSACDDDYRWVVLDRGGVTGA
ncbi:MAG: radical SAM protein [Polyangiaceae bacterium]|nr:radical SAM protein [Polyangiaceae bacterium]